MQKETGMETRPTVGIAGLALGGRILPNYEARDGWLSSGMEVGVNDGYAAIDRMLADGSL